MAIGTGKSFVSKIIGLYHYHRLDSCDNVYTSLGLAGGTKLAMSFFHNSENTATRDFKGFFNLVFDISPYFRHLYNNPPIRLIASGYKSKAGILGTQNVFTIASEISFAAPKDGIEKIGEILGRYESRFKTKRFTFGGVIADSSANTEEVGGAIDKFREGVPPEEEFEISPSQWMVRPELYAESNGETFKFYRGDAIRGPYCIESDEEILKNNLDPDRIIDVPVSAKYRFITSPERSLRDLAGICYSPSTDLFFHNDLSHFIKCSSMRNLMPEIIDVDFYDTTDTIFDKVSPMFYRIPRGTNLFLGLDIGLVDDICGVSAAYLDGEVSVGNALLPKIKFPFIFGLSRKPGQATSLDHIFQFIQQIRQNGMYVSVSADSFSSAGLFQSLERAGIEYKAISVDRTMDAGIMLKNIINTDRAEMPRVERLLREAAELRIVGNGKNGDHMKIDHPAVSTCYTFADPLMKPNEAMKGSKDLWDSICQSTANLMQKYSEYKEGGVGGGIQKSMQAIDSITKDPREETAKVFQDMIESIW